MVRHIQLGLLLGAASFFLFLLLGLFYPWLLVWWEEIQTRRKVIKLYGSLVMICLVLYFLLDYWQPTL